jgi:hypothetical protein
MKGTGFKSDKYRKSRGGHSRWLSLSCEKCGSHVLTYQKDGPGILKRLYLDRIVEPSSLVGLQKHAIKSVGNLVCKKCKILLGAPYLYEKEKRPAFRLFVGALNKKIVKANAI